MTSVHDYSPIVNPFLRDNPSDTLRCCNNRLRLIIPALKKSPRNTNKLAIAIKKLDQVREKMDDLIKTPSTLSLNNLKTLNEQTSKLLQVAELLRYRNDCIKYVSDINYINLALCCIQKSIKDKC